MSSPTTDRPPGAASSSDPKPLGARAWARRHSLLTRKAPSDVWRVVAGSLSRVPAAAWLCALVACANAVAWSVITPPFQTPDEPEHVAYVKQVAETGRLPSATGEDFSLEERVALEDLRLGSVAEETQEQPISTLAQEEKLESDLTESRQSTEPGSEYAGVATSQPPLYYAIEAIPYDLDAGATLLDRIELMRLVSALMCALTAFFGYLFVREVLPGVRQAWLVGGLGVALTPLLGFMSGSVNPDAMLFAVTAALFYGLARGFRRGLTRRLAIALGVGVAVGFATKLNFVGVAPGVLLGVILLGIRTARRSGSKAYVSLIIALAIALSPVVAYVTLHLISGETGFGIFSSGVESTHGSLLSELSYIWQLYLPRLPGMHEYFAGLFTTRQLWFRGYVGLYGWLDTTFPGWVYDVALIPAALILVLCVRGIAISTGALRGRIGEFVVYCAMALGLMALIGADSYLSKTTTEYAQVRYLLPLLPLLGLIYALATRGAGRRWAPVVGTAIVMLCLTHDIASQLQTVARFYG